MFTISQKQPKTSPPMPINRQPISLNPKIAQIPPHIPAPILLMPVIQNPDLKQLQWKQPIKLAIKIWDIIELTCRTCYKMYMPTTICNIWMYCCRICVNVIYCIRELNHILCIRIMASIMLLILGLLMLLWVRLMTSIPDREI